MLREIITLAEKNVTLQLPDEMVGKTVEVIAFEITSEKPTVSKQARLKQIDDITSRSLTDLSKFKFNRDEANDYGS